MNEHERTNSEPSASAALAFGVVTIGILGVIALVVALVVGKSDTTSSVAATGEAKTVEVMRRRRLQRLLQPVQARTRQRRQSR